MDIQPQTRQDFQAHYRAAKARIEAPRVIVPKSPVPRSLELSLEALSALGFSVPLVPLTPRRYTGPAALDHIRAYRVHQFRARHPQRQVDETIRPKCWRVVEAVSKASGISVADLRSNRRTREISLARHVAMYLCRELAGACFPEIGRRLGDKDHTSALFAVRKIEAIKDREDVADMIAAARENLGASL